MGAEATDSRRRDSGWLRCAQTSENPTAARRSVHSRVAPAGFLRLRDTPPPQGSLRHWRGRRCFPRPHEGVPEDAQRANLRGHLRILRQLPNLADKSPVPLDVFKRMVEAEKFEPDIITFDSLNRTMPGANEDTPSLSLVFDRLGQLQEWRPGLTIVLLHHTKKDELKFRGGQVIAGNADGLLYVERPYMSVMRATVTCDWFRNAANFTAFSFTCGLAPVLTDEGSQDFPAINWIGPADAKTEDQDDQGWKSKRSA